jgi:cell division protein FtsN
LHHLYDQLKEKTEFSFEPRQILAAAIGLSVFGAAMLYSGILLSERGGPHKANQAVVPMAIQSVDSPSFVASSDARERDGQVPDNEPELVHVSNLGSAIPARAPKNLSNRKKRTISPGISRVLRSVGPVPVPEEKIEPPKLPSAESLVPSGQVEAAVATPIRQIHRTLFRRANSGGEAIARGTDFARSSVQKGAAELANETGEYRNTLRRSLGRTLDQTAQNYVPPEPVKEAPKPEPVAAPVPVPTPAVAVLPKAVTPAVAVLPKMAAPKRKAVAKAKPRVEKPAPAHRAYTIQIHAFKEQGTAQEVANAIGSFKGKPAKIRTQQGDSVIWYRVQIGSFTNLADARSFQKSFEAQKGLANTFLVAR